MNRISATVFFILTPLGAFAHHSVASFFDLSSPMEIEGMLTSARWQNPHALLEVDVVLANGQTQHWFIESGGPTLLRRLGVTEEIINVGENVTISGYPSRVDDDKMIGVSIELPDGSSMPLFPTLASRFGLQLKSGVHITRAAVAESERTAEGIFRVWTYGRTSNRPVVEPSFTPEALAGQAAYDPLVDDPALQCIPHSMPAMMDNPFPIRFRDLGDVILFETEIWALVRTIHMGDDPDDSEFRGTPLGFSVGRWEDDTLVVTTTDIDGLYFDDFGTPQSALMEVEERFTLSADETRLDYEAIAIDPDTLLEPAHLGWHWEWVPGETLQDYSCTL